MTGHSLGGGLASYASALTQIPALTVNAAGPSYPHLLAIGGANLVRSLTGGKTFDNIVHVNTRRDPLRNSDAGHPWSDQVYTVEHPRDPSLQDLLNSPGVYGTILEAHGLDYFLEAFAFSQPVRRQR